MINRHLHIAIPAINEFENLENINSDIRNQTQKNFTLYICINQPDTYWSTNPEICLNNQKSIEYIKKRFPKNTVIIDKSSKTKGWTGKNIGVGIARKTLMDFINDIAENEDIIISLDADTRFNSNYFQSILENFNQNPEIPAISVPYYHKLTDDEAANRAILRYEIYMRYYALNLKRIGSPYDFTALGSAIAVKVKTYRKIGGITPKKSGEDFYFLQKIIKYKAISNNNSEIVYPAARFSNRVFFGTGPAMIKGDSGDWSSYPIYSLKLFDKVKDLFILFTKLYNTSIKTDFDKYISVKEEDPWEKLRQNSTTEAAFVKACHNRFDGLRTLQFLKDNQQKSDRTDIENLFEFLDKFYPNHKFKKLDSLLDYSIEDLDLFRNFLMEKLEEN